jgi:uncharacterized iron-regulated membrane protein
MSQFTETRPVGGLYQAFWRWHFYAGLMVMPLLMLMALTGGLYLFRTEIDAVVYRPLTTVAAGPFETSPQTWVDAAELGLGGQAVQVTRPARPEQSAQVVVAQPDGRRRTAFVDPHDGRFLGSIPEGGVMGWVKQLHGLTLFGPVANLLVEVAAGWAVVLVATGLVLWWPRGRTGGVVTVRGGPARRLFWRDLHAVAGLFAGGVIVFLAVTGMPWSAVWGQQARALVTATGLGRPPAPAAVEHHAAGPAPAVPWTLQETDMHAGHMMAASGINPVVEAADAAGLGRPYVVTIPAGPGLAWSAAYMPARVEATRTLYLGGDGGVVADIGYGDFGAGAKAIEWGIAVHQGGQFGRVNQLVMLAGCVAVWLLGISALVMWWKRRPRGGRLAAPARPVDRRAYLPLAAVVGPLAVIYPLVGASLVLALLADLGVQRLARRAAAQG